MENSLKKKSCGYSNPSFTGTSDYSQVNNFHNKMVASVIDETLTEICDSDIDYGRSMKRTGSTKGKMLRSSSDPCRNDIVPFMNSLVIDERKYNSSSWENSSIGVKEHSPTLGGKIQNAFLASKSVAKIREYNTEKSTTRTCSSWPQTYVKPSYKPTSSQSCLPSNLKFSSRGLPTQNSNFTPLMYRRAISLRGHSNRQNIEVNKCSKNGSSSFRTILRRSNSEKASANTTPRTEESNGIFSRNSPLANSFKRFGSHSSDLSSKGRQKIENENIWIEDSTSTVSDDSLETIDITEIVKNNVCNHKLFFQSSEAFSNDLAYFNKNLEEYVLSLSDLLTTYDKMKMVTPEKIRQHFDLPLKIIQNIFTLQCEINRTVRESNGSLMIIARAFLSEQFLAYQQYMITSPSLLADFRHYKEHFELNFPVFKSLILLPASKLNFYVQTLISFLKFASLAERTELERAITYLEDLKWNANTEMTIKMVKDSPVDLHLGGRILNVGELNYTNGPLPKRSYYLIGFENMLVVTISKVSYCVYVTHYRPEQIISVEGERSLELSITTATCVHGIQETHHFRSSDKAIDKWFVLIDEWILDKIASYEITSDSKNYISSYNTGKNFPLSLWQVFPFLKKLFSKNNFTTIKSTHKLCSLLVEKETEYVEKLNNIFNPETLPPPPELRDLLQRILNLHEIYFLPELKQALKKNDTLVIDIYMNYLQKFSTYKTYLIKRSLCTTHMPDGVRAQYYVVPVQHFSFYVEWAKELGFIEKFREASAFAVDTLLTYITDAKVMLLHEAIPNCCLDFYRTGELKRGGYMDIRVRPRQKGLRDGSYLILLFEKVLLILRTVSPTYNLVFDVWLYQVNFGPPSENSNSFKLEYRQGRSKSHINFEFKTQTAITKQEWVEQLTQELHSQAEQIKKSSALKNVS